MESERKVAEHLSQDGKSSQGVLNNHTDISEPQKGECDNLLENELQRLNVKDDKSEVVKHDGGDEESLEKHKHQYEVALERAEKNVQSGLKLPMKLNR